MILVTGGTGLVGAHLLYQLAKENDTVRAIYRSQQKLECVKKVFSLYTNNFENLFSKIDWVKADITDVLSLKKVFSSEIDYVYHCAAMISFNQKDYRAMRQVNIEGTANIVNFSIDAKVKKLCFVSSIAAVGDSINGNFITEENERTNPNQQHGYSITKFGAEMEVWRGSQEGLEVIIVNPGVILGSGFFNEGSGKIFEQVYNGFMFYTEGITGFVGVKDVVKAMVKLTKSNIKNERFILVAENKSFKDIFFSIANAFGKKRPSIKTGKIATEVFWRIDWLLTKITGKTPLLTKNSAKSAHKKELYSSDKIKNALNFEFESIDLLIQDVCKDYTNLL